MFPRWLIATGVSLPAAVSRLFTYSPVASHSTEMAKRSKNEDDEVSVSESAEEASPPPAKKVKKQKEKKTEKKERKPKASIANTAASDSGPKKGSVAKNVFSNSDGEKFVDLGKKRRLTVRRFKGSIFVDIREFYGDEDNLNPGKKGISLSVDQWEEIKANIDMIDELIEKA